MRRLLLAAVLVVGGLVFSAGRADAQYRAHRPMTSSVTWPSASPAGWYTSTYKHAWFYPWYAYYDFSSGPYANWAAGGGYAGYASHGPAGYFHYPIDGFHANYGDGAPAGTPAPHGTVVPGAEPKGEGQVSVTLPADAKLLFNGAAAPGTGAVRTFRTPALEKGISYRYELTAEVTRDGRTERVTETVVVRAGETAKVTLDPTGIATAGAK